MAAVPVLRATAVMAHAGTSPGSSSETRTINVVKLGADPAGGVDAAPAFQAAIDRLLQTGGVIYIPAGNYRIGKTLEWINPGNSRMPGILFRGDGQHSSVLRSMVRSGPLLRVRGSPLKGPVSTTFFWGGGICDLSLEGAAEGTGHDCLELLGWWSGEIVNCQIVGFPRHGIRAITDLALDPNPDFSASRLFVRAIRIERCGGWGFIDDGGVQGAPGWSWDRCDFALCGKGGAFVQSGGHSFVKCSFSACGWQAENSPPAARAYGLYFTGAATAACGHWVEGCEFDTNFTAHIGARFLSTSSFINNRFIFNDRYRAGRLCPGRAVEIGSGDARAAILAVEFRQSFFRFDLGGQAIGFDWVNTANVRDIDISGSVFSDNSGGTLKLIRYRLGGAHGQSQAFGYSIRDRELPSASGNERVR
jgi:hypothetical protein